MKIRIKKLDERALTPTYGTEYSAGADLYALLDDAIEIQPNETKLVKTLPLSAVGHGKGGLLCLRQACTL